jgi:hypothetical protein
MKGATVIQLFCESYVRAMLDRAAGEQNMSRDDFYRLFRGHITAGFRPEVDEAPIGTLQGSEIRCTPSPQLEPRLRRTALTEQ